MLKSLLKGILSKSGRSSLVIKKELVDKCQLLVEQGEARKALKLYQDYSKRYPDDVDIINDIACICDELGLKDQSAYNFLLAYQLDDRNLSVVLNYIRFNSEHCNIVEAQKALKNLMLDGFPARSYLTLIASIDFKLGNASSAREAALEAWLNNFTSQSNANNFLMHRIYSEGNESRIAAEHIFWAETLPPVILKDSTLDISQFPVKAKGERIRVAYWSPDFRHHSVRYFIRPVIENHSRDDFEIICYYDMFKWDDQTEAISESAEYFFQVNELTDSALIRLMRHHEIDILVEMAGHTSANRLHMLQERVAKVQITGFGYPPTTGLKSVDFKILDKYVARPAVAEEMYAENILALEHSFWCFDPKVKVPILLKPPVEENGYVTFGCFGNIAKITDRVLSAWCRILDNVPNSTLLIRSIFFEDASSIAAMENRISKFGIAPNRFQLLLPLGTDELFSSYNGVDIVLDTFPFSGGTTTCFATYMGVPVLTLAGLSLVSRMGGSVMSSLGMQEWICADLDEYIEKATRFSGDASLLASFRANARDRYDSSALGNGKLFVADLEKAYRQALSGEIPLSQSKRARIEEQELLRRARRVMASGQYDAAMRIVDYCLREYPGCGEAVVMKTWQYIGKSEYSEAASMVMEALSAATSGVPDLHVQALRIAVYSGDSASYRDCLQKFNQISSSLTRFKDAFFLKLLNSARDPVDQFHKVSAVSADTKMLVIVVGGDGNSCAALDGELYPGVTYRHVSYGDRLECYQDINDLESYDFVILSRSDYKINCPSFVDTIKRSLTRLDIVGFAGSKLWGRFDWLNGPISTKEACVWLPIADRKGMFELNLYTNSFDEIETGMVVLDGGLLVMKPQVFDRFRAVEWPFENGGSDFLFEQYAVNKLNSSNFRLGICKSLGLSVSPDAGGVMKIADDHDMKRFVAETLGFEELFPASDYSCIAFPFHNIEDGVRALTETLINNEK